MLLLYSSKTIFLLSNERVKWLREKTTHFDPVEFEEIRKIDEEDQ